MNAHFKHFPFIFNLTGVCQQNKTEKKKIWKNTFRLSLTLAHIITWHDHFHSIKSKCNQTE